MKKLLLMLGLALAYSFPTCGITIEPLDIVTCLPKDICYKIMHYYFLRNGWCYDPKTQLYYFIHEKKRRSHLEQFLVNPWHISRNYKRSAGQFCTISLYQKPQKEIQKITRVPSKHSPDFFISVLGPNEKKYAIIERQLFNIASPSTTLGTIPIHHREWICCIHPYKPLFATIKQSGVLGLYSYNHKKKSFDIIATKCKSIRIPRPKNRAKSWSVPNRQPHPNIQGFRADFIFPNQLAFCNSESIYLINLRTKKVRDVITLKEIPSCMVKKSFTIHKKIKRNAPTYHINIQDFSHTRDYPHLLLIQFQITPNSVYKRLVTHNSCRYLALYNLKTKQFTFIPDALKHRNKVHWDQEGETNFRLRKLHNGYRNEIIQSTFKSTFSFWHASYLYPMLLTWAGIELKKMGTPTNSASETLQKILVNNQRNSSTRRLLRRVSSSLALNELLEKKSSKK